MRRFAVIGSLSAAVAVGAGAFGAHALRARVEPRMLDVFETAARYQMYHALALFAVAWLMTKGERAAAMSAASGWAFVAGTVLFSGSLYAMALTGIRWLGAITPLGGVCFLAGWLLLAAASARSIAAEPRGPLL